MNLLHYLLLPLSALLTATPASNIPIFLTNSTLATSLYSTLPATNIASVNPPTLPPADTEWLDIPAEDLATFFKIPNFSFRSGVTIQYVCETSAGSPRVADAVGAIVALGNKPGSCIQMNPYPIPGCTTMNRHGGAAVGECGMKGWAVNCMEAANYLSYLPYRCSKWYGGVQQVSGLVRVMYIGGPPGLLVNLYHT